MGDAYRLSGSVTQAYTACGIADYLRQSTEISALHADPQDLGMLRLSPGAIVLVAKAVNTDLEGLPIQFSITRFPADLVQLKVGE